MPSSAFAGSSGENVLNLGAPNFPRKLGMGMAREKIRNAMGYHDTHMYGMLKRDY